MSKLSYSKGPETPLVGLTLAQVLHQTAERYPDREALVSRHQRLRFTWRELAAEVSVIYGQTEASPVITMHAPGDTQEQRGSTIGRAMPNTEVRIVDLEGDTVPTREPGELCARGYLVMKGYDQEPEATAGAIDSDGWLHTGGLTVMREDGHFNIRGRSKEMIHSGRREHLSRRNRKLPLWTLQGLRRGGRRTAGSQAR